MKADLTFDIHYGYWFNLACERFYRHVDITLNFVQLVGGSGAALAVINGSPGSVVAAGLLLAVCAALSLLIAPAVKAERHLQCKHRWLELKPMIATTDEPTLAQLVAQAQANGPAGIAALAVPAFNRTMCATGRENALRPESRLQKLASLLA
jgi:hypothetical protein